MGEKKTLVFKVIVEWWLELWSLYVIYPLGPSGKDDQCIVSPSNVMVKQVEPAQIR